MSTRRVDDLVRALGLEGMSKSEVSRICASLDAEVAAFRARSLAETAYPYLWLDATYLKVREAGRVVSMAALVAIGVAMTGERRVLGLELAAGNDEGSAWPRFVRSLCERGLHGVRLVISDDHAGLVRAIREQLLGSGWQRCRVHLTRNAQELVPRSARSMVASAIRMVIEQPDGSAARAQLDHVIAGLRGRFPAVAELLLDAELDLLAHFAFPETHRRPIRSTDESVKRSSVELTPDAGDRRGEEQGFGDVSLAAQPAPSRQRVAPGLRHPRLCPSAVVSATQRRSAGIAPRRQQRQHALGRGPCVSSRPSFDAHRVAMERHRRARVCAASWP